MAADITERKRAEEALRRSEKLAATGRLAATMAHEINNPLEAVIDLIYLAGTSSSRDDTRKYLERCVQVLLRRRHGSRALGMQKYCRTAWWKDSAQEFDQT